jgi:hypothetical protein
LLPGLQYNLPADSVEGEAMAVELRLEHQLAQCCLSRSSTAGRAVSEALPTWSIRLSGARRGGTTNE